MASYQPPAPTYGQLADRLEIKMTQIVEKGLDFHARIWNMTPAELDKYAANHGAGIKLKMESFRMFYNKAVPSQGKLVVEHKGGQGITPEDLAKMGVPMEALRELANMQVVEGEVVSHEVEDADKT